MSDEAGGAVADFRRLSRRRGIKQVAAYSLLLTRLLAQPPHVAGRFAGVPSGGLQAGTALTLSLPRRRTRLVDRRSRNYCLGKHISRVGPDKGPAARTDQGFSLG
jgi:hypothetical protein